MFTQAQVAEQCTTYGPQLAPLPAGVDGIKLLWAMSGNESSFGSNTTPRHEPAFDVGGLYAASAPMPELLAKYGSAAACSYGPWQILLANAPDFAPDDFSDVAKAAQATTAFLNSLLRRFRPSTLAQIGYCWNAGHIPTPAEVSAGVAQYAAELASNYNHPTP